MSGTSSYNNDKVVTAEVEYPACDPASGAFFQPDYKKNDDLKSMLDGSKDSLKLEAMKRIIGMIAKGRDASDLFPAVVKNVVSKNIEVKKLVYVYLVRYAEEQQDLALLSISTFQRALKDPNQLIRASALRVLSSVRVPMIVPIVMLAIRESAADMSPYVRKTAAHAIPKLYSLDPEQKEELVSIIDKLLSDKAPLVVGSAAMAFSEVCPDRISLIHRSYRKLCSLLADVDEWGQLALLSVLTMYARACFPDPNTQDVSSDSESEKSFYEYDTKDKADRGSTALDADHRLLVRAARPLLQSRNAGVVMAVAQLYYHCGPASELPPVAKALVRLLRAPPEVQSVVLNAVASITVTRPGLFEPFLKSFFVRTSDPTHIKLLKLEVLTNLATEASAPSVLREFQTYVSSSDKAFAGATIQAIGRLAATIQSETETCLNGLLQLLSSKDEWVVCEAVVVVKRVVGGGAGSARAAVGRAARLLTADRLAGVARAAGVWLVAEHGARHPRAARVLAHMAAGFAEQEELVKLQLLSLAMKLSITQPATLPLCCYVVTLARYDNSYDVRDRARMLRRLLEPKSNSQLAPYAAEIFCPDKPSPTIESSFKERSQFAVGSLSQYVGSACAGHRPLPPHPDKAVAASLRDTAPVAVVEEPPKNKKFYSEPESSGSDSSSSSSEEESSDEEESNEEKKVEKAKEANNYKSSNSGTSDSETDSGSSSEESDSEEESSDEEKAEEKPQNDILPAPATQSSKNNAKSNLELLLELDDVAGGLPTMTPTLGGFLTPAQGNDQTDTDEITSTSAALVPATRFPLVPAVAARGLRVAGGWPRHTHLASRQMTSVTLYIDNTTQEPVTNLRVHKKTLTGSRSIQDFPPLGCLPAGGSASLLLGVDFADSIQPIEFTIQSSLGEIPISITPQIGELVGAVSMSAARWDAELARLRGMNECDKKVSKLGDDESVCRRVLETANVAAISSTGDVLRFAGRLTSSEELVLVCVRREAGNTAGRVVANCGNMAVAAMLANEVANALEKE